MDTNSSRNISFNEKKKPDKQQRPFGQNPRLSKDSSSTTLSFQTPMPKFKASASTPLAFEFKSPTSTKQSSPQEVFKLSSTSSSCLTSPPTTDHSDRVASSTQSFASSPSSSSLQSSSYSQQMPSVSTSPVFKTPFPPTPKGSPKESDAVVVTSPKTKQKSINTSPAQEEYRMMVENLLDFGSSFCSEADHWKSHYETALLDVDRLSTYANDKEAELKQANVKISGLQQMLETSRKDLEHAHAGIKEKLEKLFHQANSNYQNLSEKIESKEVFQKSEDALKSRIAELETELEKITLERHRLEANLSVELEQEKNRSDQEKSELTNKLAEAEKNLKNLQEELGQLQKNYDISVEKKEQLQSSLNEELKENALLKELLRESKAEIDQLKSQLQIIQSLLDRLEEIQSNVCDINSIKTTLSDFVSSKWALFMEQHAQWRMELPVMNSKSLNDLQIVSKISHEFQQQFKSIHELLLSLDDDRDKLSAKDFDVKLGINLDRIKDLMKSLLKENLNPRIDFELNLKQELLETIKKCSKHDETKLTEHDLEKLKHTHNEEIKRLTDEHMATLKSWVDLSNDTQVKVDTLSSEKRHLESELEKLSREKQTLENEVHVLKKRQEEGERKGVKRVSFTKQEPNYEDIYQVLNNDLSKEEFAPTSLKQSDSAKAASKYGHNGKRNKAVDGSDSLIKRRKKL